MTKKGNHKPKMYKQIAENKRATASLMIGFVAFIACIGCIFAYFAEDWSIAIYVLIIAIFYALVQYFLANSLAVNMTGAEKIEKKDNPRLYKIVENLSLSAGLPMPEVYIINDPAPNAFATGRDPNHALVAATTGLLDIMDDKELAAVMAHEMSHVKNYDIRVSMTVFALTCVIGVLADFASRLMFYGDRRRDDEGSPIAYLLLALVAIFAPLIALLARQAVSREREYLADASAVNLTRYPDGMINALKKLETHSRPMKNQNPATEALYINNPLRSGGLSNLFSTHPPLEKRIERLEHGKNNF